MTPPLDPRRHALAPPPERATPAAQPSAGELLSLRDGGRGWTSPGVSVVVRSGATAAELRAATAELEGEAARREGSW